jgi:hypothetical protein
MDDLKALKHCYLERGHDSHRVSSVARAAFAPVRMEDRSRSGDALRNMVEHASDSW